MKRLAGILLILVTVVTVLGQRRINPVNTPGTRTQPVKASAAVDSLRALERKRARSVHMHAADGSIVLIDTLTNQEWVDSAMLPKAPKMIYPLMHAVSAGVNIWDPLMRLFGTKYGGASAFVSLSLHNRYKPFFEFGMGTAKKKPDDQPWTYHSPLSPFFKIGCDYNFVYNSNPDYQFLAGLRYGFSPFKYSVTGAVLDDPYWGETVHFDVPDQKITAGWLEFTLGLRVKLFGPISAGWSFSYHTILHQSDPPGGKAWYIPGYGTQSSSISGALNILYTFNLGSAKN